MSDIRHFPIVTVIMVIITFFFIVMYMMTSHLFFYGENSIKEQLEKTANETMEDSFFLDSFFNNSENQKLFFQYGMVTSVCLTPICGVLELLIGRKKSQGDN